MIQSLKPLAQAALNVGRFVTGPRTATTADMARIRRAMGERCWIANCASGAACARS